MVPGGSVVVSILIWTLADAVVTAIARPAATPISVPESSDGPSNAGASIMATPRSPASAAPTTTAPGRSSNATMAAGTSSSGARNARAEASASGR